MYVCPPKKHCMTTSLLIDVNAKQTVMLYSNRERQKEMINNLQKEVEDKMGQLQLLSAENEILKLRTSVLESAVSNRELAVSILIWCRATALLVCCCCEHAGCMVLHGMPPCCSMCVRMQLNRMAFIQD